MWPVVIVQISRKLSAVKVDPASLSALNINTVSPHALLELLTAHSDSPSANSLPNELNLLVVSSTIGYCAENAGPPEQSNNGPTREGFDTPGRTKPEKAAAGMCHQVSYRLLCEHIKTQIIFCADAVPEHRAEASSTNESHTGVRSSSKSGHKTGLTSKPFRPCRKIRPSSPSSSLPAQYKRPCANLTIQSLPYPTPPSISENPSSFSFSPLSPRCPLLDYPFEQKNRFWKNCWCGKAYNRIGRCSCVMLIDNSQVRCEHICCHHCTTAADTADYGNV